MEQNENSGSTPKQLTLKEALENYVRLDVEKDRLAKEVKDNKAALEAQGEALLVLMDVSEIQNIKVAGKTVCIKEETKHSCLKEDNAPLIEYLIGEEILEEYFMVHSGKYNTLVKEMLEHNEVIPWNNKTHTIRKVHI